MSIIVKVIDLNKSGREPIVDKFVEERTDLFGFDSEGHPHMTQNLIKYKEEFEKNYNREAVLLTNYFPEQGIMDINVFLQRGKEDVL